MSTASFSRRVMALGLLVSACSNRPADRQAGDDAPAGDARAAGDTWALGDAPILTQADECATSRPEWVFCSSFEEGSKDIWDDYDGNPDSTNQLLSDPGPFDLADNHVMRLYPPPGRGGADLVKVLPTQHDRLYARWYVKWDANYDFSAANHGSGLHAGDRSLLGRSDFQPNGSDWFSAWIEPDSSTQRLYSYSYYRGMYQDCADPNGACWGDHFPCTSDEGETYCERSQHRETVLPPLMQTDRWYCIELLLDGGSPVPSDSNADGQLNWWIDGLAVGPWADLWLRTTSDLKISILWLSLFHHGDHADAGVEFDNVVVSTERIGCLGN